jgi:gluconate 2-dehydrogenase gamma chain
LKKTASEAGDKQQNLSRRKFVRIVRDSAILLVVPQGFGCSRVGSNDSRSASGADEKTAYELKFLTKEEAKTVEAVAARIIPSDERPGAKEAQVVNFIDYMLTTAYSDQQAVYRDGLQQLDKTCQRRFTRPFAQLAEVDQDNVLSQLELRNISEWEHAGDFFFTIRNHTIEGMFSDPKYHGNAGRVGWEVMGV